MAPIYKLHYFTFKAVAEPIRFLLSYGGLEFEDIRYEREDWLKVKHTTPFGQMPLLEIDGKVAYQSIAIERYIAKQVNLVGASDWENLEIDAIVDTVNDLRHKVATYRYETDATLKASLKVPLFTETLPYYLSRLEAIAEKNNGHLALGRLTWADVYFASIVETFNTYTETDMLADYPNLRAVKENVYALPTIKAWVEKRPKTDF